MADDIVTQLRDQAQAPALAWLADAAEEIERLRELVKSYGFTRQGITLNWTTDRHGNWAAFAAIDKVLLEEARRG